MSEALGEEANRLLDRLAEKQRCGFKSYTGAWDDKKAAIKRLFYR